MGSFLKKIYSKSPIWIQNIGISAYGYKWKERRFGGIFNSEVIKFKNRESFSNQDWLDYQTDKLRKLLLHAFEMNKS